MVGLISWTGGTSPQTAKLESAGMVAAAARFVKAPVPKGRSSAKPESPPRSEAFGHRADVLA